MTYEKVSYPTIQRWLESGRIPEDGEILHALSSADKCRAIENIKKGISNLASLDGNCKIINSRFIPFDLSKNAIAEALEDEDFYKNHVNKNENGLSIASYISLYYQYICPEERDNFVKDIEF